MVVDTERTLRILVLEIVVQGLDDQPEADKYNVVTQSQSTDILPPIIDSRDP